MRDDTVISQTNTSSITSSSIPKTSKREMNAKTEKIVRRTTMVATVVASYFLLTADYGPQPNFLDPIKKGIRSAENSVREFVFGSKGEPQNSNSEKTQQS